MDKPTKKTHLLHSSFLFFHSHDMSHCRNMLVSSLLFFIFSPTFFLFRFWNLISCDVKTLPILYNVVGFLLFTFCYYYFKKTQGIGTIPKCIFILFKKKTKKCSNFASSSVEWIIATPCRKGGDFSWFLQKESWKYISTYRKLNSILFCTWLDLSNWISGSPGCWDIRQLNAVC